MSNLRHKEKIEPMPEDLTISSAGTITTACGGPILPAIIAEVGDHAARRFIEFFSATIRNGHTRRAYARAGDDFFAWCQESGQLPDKSLKWSGGFTTLLTVKDDRSRTKSRSGYKFRSN